MKEIPLTRGRVAIVDDADFDYLSRFKWNFATVGYAVRHAGGGRKNRRVSYMHRVIASAEAKDVVDHINGDTLDNRRANLRIGDKCLNSINRKPQSNNTSGYRGVDFDKRRGKWSARIKTDGRQRYLGRFPSMEEAVRARKDAEEKYLARFPSVGSPPT